MFPFTDETMESQRNLGALEELGIQCPLDASQLPRLLNLRVAKARDCACIRCDDLLEKLHHKTRLLEVAHQAEAPGVAFWMQIAKDGNIKHFECEIDKKLKLTPSELTRHDEFLDTLVEVEHDWQRSQRATCTGDDSDRFWLQHYQDIKDSIAAQRDYMQESLDELREAVVGEYS